MLKTQWLSRELIVFHPPHLLSDSLDRLFSGLVGEDFRRVLEHIPASCETYVVGGVLRDLLLKRIRKIDRPVRDIDLVISGAASEEDLQSSFPDFSSRLNRMGGIKFKVRPQGPVFDIWRIEDHLNLRAAGPPYTIERLLRHFLLDVEAVLWNPRTGDLFDYGCLHAIQAGQIDLVGPEGISQAHAAVQVAHIILVAHNTHFSLSRRAADFVRETLRSHQVLEEVYSVLREKQSTAMRDLSQLIEEIVSDQPDGSSRAAKGDSHA